ncbi:hypothetical protein [Krasilnikovia sp. MM14-A1259]|uniref:hypothetical protein n=1 Tax=Krasilnikovia sp. MM14-A1259 TaxID=3373539 RepID=UPI003806F5CF
MLRPAVLLFALLMSAPAVYRYVTDEVDITQVLIRFLIAVPIAALLLAGLRFVTAGYGKTDEESPDAETAAEPAVKPAAKPAAESAVKPAAEPAAGATKPAPGGTPDPESAEQPS